MDPRLQAGVELQLDKQGQEHDSSLSGVLGQYLARQQSPSQTTRTLKTTGVRRGENPHASAVEKDMVEGLLSRSITRGTRSS